MTLIAASASDFIAPNLAEWTRRLRADARQIDKALPRRLRELHDVVVERARKGGASALVLSGSTARLRRTEISDLDYHLIGQRIITRDLSLELDVHVASVQKLREDILSGDDFVQWSLRFGCIVFDRGPLLDAMRLIAAERPWPDAARKVDQARKSVEMARRFIDAGDDDAALVQVRTALTLSARAYLLSRRIFPLARAELPEQLAAAGCAAAGVALAAVIHDAPDLPSLRGVLDEAESLLVVPSPRSTSGL